MLKVLYLLVFTTIIVVNCQNNCPAYSDYPNYTNKNNAAQSLLNGTFTLAYTSSSDGIDCHRIKYEIDANNVTTAYSEFPNCCLTLKNFEFDSDQISYTIGPYEGSQQWCSYITADYQGSMKIVTTTGTGDSLCLVLAVCEPAYYGLMVMCRGAAPQILTITSTLTALVGSTAGLTDVVAMKSANPLSCALEDYNCPNF